MLKFPLEDQNKYKAKIFFQKHQSTPLDLTKTAGLASTLAAAGLDALKFGGKVGLQIADGLFLPGDQIQSFPRKQINTAKQRGPSAEPSSKRLETEAGLPGSCVMYLPQQILISDGVNLNETSLGIFGGIVERALQGGGSIAGAFAQALGEAGSAITDVATGNVDPDIFAIAAGRLSQVQPTTNAAIRSATAVTPNPNLRVIFEGVTLRKFNVAFEMMPKSPRETEAAKNVIKYFRSGMIPESIRAGGISAGFRTPSKFEIKMSYDGEVNEDGELISGTRLATKFKKCFLQNVNVTYNGQNMAFLPDGNFQRYEITLEFIEEQTIDKQDVIEGF